ncbi:hypothetical protein AVEN_123525-1 [Araneus ventricosus]|uniref:Uncharacterized protein n=1 Tax=Araneus ventricosus TaxID=182803 RepID=A0A4Y2LK93_ARAVE|nr:hypothetical protein AVEN_123525-1 [Araneus ventricosus]
MHWCPGPLKNDLCNSLDTEFGVLTAITGPSRKGCVSSSVPSNSIHTITVFTREERARLVIRLLLIYVLVVTPPSVWIIFGIIKSNDSAIEANENTPLTFL